MLTYMGEKTRPWSAMASARLVPSFTRSRTRVRTLLSVGCSTCSASARNDSTRGTEAPTSVASCRVVTAWSTAETRRGLRPAAKRLGTASRPTPASSRTSVGKMPSLRSLARAALALSASRIPFVARPSARNPRYSKTAKGYRPPG